MKKQDLAKIFKQSGFMDSEGKELIKHEFNTNSIPFKLMLKNRKKYIASMRKSFYTNEQIKDFITAYYDNPKKHPLDFYRIECKLYDEAW